MSKRRFSLVLVVGFLLATVTPAPSQAAITSSVAGGALTVDGDGASDFITITCAALNAKVNGADPDTGVATCASITAITLSGNGGDDQLSTISVSPGAFTSLTTIQQFGGPANDTLIGSNGMADDLQGEDGDDILIGGAGNDTMDGGPGTDTAGPGSFSADVTITDTQIVSTSGGTDTISGFESAILATSGGTIDSSAFSGTTFQSGSVNSDSLIGGPGADQFFPGEGTNTVTGNGGSDEFHQTADVANDVLSGGQGKDTIFATDSMLILTDISLEGQSAIDSFTGIEKAELTALADGAVNAAGFSGPTTLFGSNVGDETLIGGNGPDVAKGFDGDDTIKGRNGNDKLFGQDGNDTLIGGKGKDRCTGGPGADTIKSCE